MFGHALRMNENTPAQKAMKYKGRKRATVVTTLKRDIEHTTKHNNNFDLPSLKTQLDLQNFTKIASNRKEWRKIVKMVTDAAHSNSVE